MATQPPADWYQDPHDLTQLRYWDGSQWTEHYAPAPEMTPAELLDASREHSDYVNELLAALDARKAGHNVELPQRQPTKAADQVANTPVEGFPWAPTLSGFLQVRNRRLYFKHDDAVGALLVDDIHVNHKAPGLFKDQGRIDVDSRNGGTSLHMEYTKDQRKQVEALLAALRREQDHSAIDIIVNRAAHSRGLDAAEAAAQGVNLKKGELLHHLFREVSLVEIKRLPGQFQAGTSSVRFRVMKGVSVGYAGTRGRYVPGPESPVPIDIGDLVITNQRFQFMGQRQSREWQFSKLIGLQSADDGTWTALPVTNRQKVSGVGYGRDHAFEVNFWLELALADFQGRRDEWARTIETQLRSQVL